MSGTSSAGTAGPTVGSGTSRGGGSSSSRRFASVGSAWSRLRQAQAAEGVPPPGALALLAGQAVTGGLARAKRAIEPVKRLRSEMAETDLHARNMRETDHLYSCGSLKGPPQLDRAKSSGARGQDPKRGRQLPASPEEPLNEAAGRPRIANVNHLS